MINFNPSNLSLIIKVSDDGTSPHFTEDSARVDSKEIDSSIE